MFPLTSKATRGMAVVKLKEKGELAIKREKKKGTLLHPTTPSLSIFSKYKREGKEKTHFQVASPRT